MLLPSPRLTLPAILPPVTLMVSAPAPVVRLPVSALLEPEMATVLLPSPSATLPVRLPPEMVKPSSPVPVVTLPAMLPPLRANVLLPSPR